MWLALLATLLAQPDATGACPSGAAVRAELVRLGAGSENPVPELVVDGNRMHVILRSSAGVVLGEREVEASADCHERATLAAVLAATWLGTWSAGPAPAPAPAAATLPAVLSPARRHELALAALASHDGNAGALGVQILATGSLTASGVGRAFVALSGLSERERNVGPGSAGYARLAVDAGPALRWQGQTLFVEGALGGRLALLHLGGTRGLAVTHSVWRVAPGLSTYVRLGLGRRAFSPFVFAGGAAWVNRYELVLDNAKAYAILPRWEVLLGLGAAWAFGGEIVERSAVNPSQE